MSMKVNLCGIEMDNPIIPASRTFGFGKEFAELKETLAKTNEILGSLRMVAE